MKPRGRLCRQRGGGARHGYAGEREVFHQADAASLVGQRLAALRRRRAPAPVAWPSVALESRGLAGMAPSISAEGSQLRWWRTLLVPLSGSAGARLARTATQPAGRVPCCRPISENADNRRHRHLAIGVGSWFLPLFALNISAC
jgi:hypothetical protein